MGGFGVNSVLYTNTNFGGVTPPAGTIDWFKSATGRNVIKQDGTTVTTITNLLQGATPNPTYEVRMNGERSSVIDSVSPTVYTLLIDALWARDPFGGTGGVDATAYPVSSKNGQNPADWNGGTANVLGKNDLIDVAGHMFRKVNGLSSDLYFVGLIQRAEPGGAAYMDFEFYIDSLYTTETSPGTLQFASGGPDLGHTSFDFDATGNISQLGDMLYNLSLDGGVTPNLEIRIWVSFADYTTIKANPATYVDLPFSFGTEFDGAFTGAPYGYASIIPDVGSDVCGYVNSSGQLPAAPPWGSKTTKYHTYQTSFSEYSVTEVGMNMTSVGLDNYLVDGVDECEFPWRTYMIKTRSSAAFTAALKDFAGPFNWGKAAVEVQSSEAYFSCDAPMIELTAIPVRNDVTYSWTTNNGHFHGSTTGSTVNVDYPGTYTVEVTLPTGCLLSSTAYDVDGDPAEPFFNSLPSLSYTLPCLGNNGTLTATVSGATSPYTYTLKKQSDNSTVAQATNVASTTYTFTGLSGDSYYVEVKGVYACVTTSAVLNIPSATASTFTPTITSPLCYGGTGSIALGTITGSSPYTYLWNTGTTAKDLANKVAGTYTVTVTNSQGCTTSSSSTITQPTAVSATISKVNDPGNSGNGSASVSVSGGTSPYTYLWKKLSDNSTIGTGTSVTGLSYGSYSVLVTDDNGCTDLESVFIFEQDICFDGIDNDGDGLNDCNDQHCVPITPTVSGNLAPCTADQITYTVTNPEVGMSYVWTVSSNVTIVSGQGTTSLVVTWDTNTPGQICVKAANEGPALPGPQVICYSSSTCLSVSPEAAPQQPVIIQKN